MLSPSFSKIDSLDHGQQPLMGNSIGMSSARRLTKNTTMIAEFSHAFSVLGARLAERYS